MSESSAGSDATAGQSAAKQPEAGQPEVGQSEVGQPEVFANRAERRAKGKKSTHPEVFGKGGQRPVGRGAVQSPRQYGNRRSG